MKKLLLMKTVLLLFALVVGSSSVWATPTTYSFSSIPTTGWSATNGGSQTINSISWTYSSCTYISATSSKIQIGSKKNPQTSDWTIQTSVSNFGTGKAISAISITAYTTETSATYDISVGGSSVKSGSLTTSSATYSATGLNATSGDIVVTMTGSSTSKAMYLENISVTYDDASSDPVIGASNVDIAADATSGEFSYTITNPVDGKSLVASVTAGGTWLSDPVVDAVNKKVTFTTTANPSYDESREGTIHLVYGGTLATKDVTITQAAAVHKYAITYTSAQTNGTLTIKDGDDVVASGAEFPEGKVLTIVTTPDENYVFRNWQYRRDGGSWTTVTSATTYTMTDKDVEFRANFDATYPANFNVNGQISTTRFKNGDAVEFPTPTSFNGYEFVGWSASAIDGSVADEPTLVDTNNETMGTAEKTYYAVYGKSQFVTPVSATFNAADITATPSTGTRTWTHAGSNISLYISAGQHYTSGTPKTFTVTKGNTNYFQISAPSGCYLKKLTVTLSGTTYPIYSVDEGASLSTSSTTQTVTINSAMNTIKCYATSNNQIRATVIVVDAVKATIEDYRTTLTQPITIGASKYATYCSSSALDFTGSAVKAYKAKVNEKKVVLTQVTEVPANTGIILYGEDGNYDIPVIESASAVTENELVGVIIRTLVEWETGGDGKKNYILQGGVFKKAADDGHLKANRAYLHTSYDVTTAGARDYLEFAFEDGDVTAIETVKSEKTDGQYYNLNGQKVQNPTKGLYIINGKKVVIK